MTTTMMTKKTKLDAIQYFFGCTRKEANEYLKTAGSKAVEEIVRGYTQDCAMSFYND